jgi:large subunit ribosomal protein L23
MDSHKVIIKPLSTEKSLRMMESENKLMFVVHRDAEKEDIKKAIKALYDMTCTDVNTYITFKGEKRAFVQLLEPAIDLATKLGMM